MSERNHEQSDINELIQLTPFGLDVYENRSKFKSGNIFVKTHVLESATPLQPWFSHTANELEPATPASI